MADERKKTYYVSMATGEISQLKTASPWDFQIEATDEEITQLREYFDQNYSTDWQAFWRAHVPYIQYHYDRENDAYDRTLTKIYEMIYRLGNEEAKEHIRSLGILPDEKEE
ncbi:hydrolase [Geobacillus stearothermophilus]|uniref:hydrolase n=1 Tax=Geobacillus stearothermophilus TaxID=1422 RepID=UPI0024026B99|nr:hydrolase [Geobacillus stearothermophilus]MDF9296257.1 hydrolase [Geobacillus stearothermophilus]WJQ13524.1 hydrolase [Geobacillus stearothermophilus]